jgi:hypothetical protein
MTGFIEWCQTNALSQLMNSAKWPFPAVEIFHIAGLVLIFGSMLVLNLRIFGRMLRAQPVPQVARGLAPVTKFGLVGQIVSGPLLLMNAAMRLSENTSFRLKMLLLIIALSYHFAVHLPLALDSEGPAFRLRLSATVSMLLWISMTLAGFSIQLLP